MSIAQLSRGLAPRVPHARSRDALLVARPSRVATGVRRSIGVRAAADEDSDTALTGEWPVNWSLASYEDVGEFFQQQMFKDSAAPGTTLKDVMATALTTVSPEDRVDSIRDLFKEVKINPFLHWLVACCRGAVLSLEWRQ